MKVHAIKTVMLELTETEVFALKMFTKAAITALKEEPEVYLKHATNLVTKLEEVE